MQGRATGRSDLRERTLGDDGDRLIQCCVAGFLLWLGPPLVFAGERDGSPENRICASARAQTADGSCGVLIRSCADPETGRVLDSTVTYQGDGCDGGRVASASSEDSVHSLEFAAPVFCYPDPTCTGGTTPGSGPGGFVVNFGGGGAGWNVGEILRAIRDFFFGHTTCCGSTKYGGADPPSGEGVNPPPWVRTGPTGPPSNLPGPTAGIPTGGGSEPAEPIDPEPIDPRPIHPGPTGPEPTDPHPNGGPAAGSTTPASGTSIEVGCEGGPDYIQFAPSVAIPQTANFVSLGVQLTLDRHGQLYVGAGPALGLPVPGGSLALVGGVLSRGRRDQPGGVVVERYSFGRREFRDFLAGHTFSLGGGGYLGAFLSRVPSGRASVEFGATTLQAGISYSYSALMYSTSVHWGGCK